MNVVLTLSRNAISYLSVDGISCDYYVKYATLTSEEMCLVINIAVYAVQIYYLFQATSISWGHRVLHAHYVLLLKTLQSSKIYDCAHLDSTKNKI